MKNLKSFHQQFPPLLMKTRICSRVCYIKPNCQNVNETIKNWTMKVKESEMMFAMVILAKSEEVLQNNLKSLKTRNHTDKHESKQKKTNQ